MHAFAHITEFYAYKLATESHPVNRRLIRIIELYRLLAL